MQRFSTSVRKRLYRLAYMVSAKECPQCSIQRDPLRRLYPDVNHGLRISAPTRELVNVLAANLQAAFERRGYPVELFGSFCESNRYTLEVWVGYKEVTLSLAPEVEK